ncbi:hypothetical protein [Desulfococcus sp.]|uniref:hypothetical protein n=1 Tax=Desulfococcus sp. TaxID=2025834 RepID=UPI003593FE72
MIPLNPSIDNPALENCPCSSSLSNTPRVSIEKGRITPVLDGTMDFEVYVEKIQAITCSQTPEEAFYLLDQAFKGSVPIKEHNEPVINGIIALMAGIAPQDPVEAMIAVQMVAIHNCSAFLYIA